MAETVTVACRLPHGLLLEVGFTKERVTLSNGQVVTRMNRSENYRTYELKGPNFPLQGALRAGMIVPAKRNPHPYINRGVPKDVWDEWVKNNRNYFALKNGDVVELKEGEANAKAATIDMMAKPIILAPLDPKAKGKITEADFAKDRAKE